MSRRHPQTPAARKVAGTLLPISFRGWIWLVATAICLAIWFAIGSALFG